MVSNILIVDDSDVFRGTLKGLISKHFPDMSVAEACSCTEAWQKLEEVSPQIVFSDLRIHKEDGLNLVEQIRAAYPDMILVVITGHDFPEYREVAYARGADCYIPKNTASSSDILSLVASFLSGEMPQWQLGSDYLNPAPPAHPWK